MSEWFNDFSNLMAIFIKIYRINIVTKFNHTFSIITFFMDIHIQKMFVLYWDIKKLTKNQYFDIYWNLTLELCTICFLLYRAFLSSKKSFEATFFVINDNIWCEIWGVFLKKNYFVIDPIIFYIEHCHSDCSWYCFILVTSISQLTPAHVQRY